MAISFPEAALACRHAVAEFEMAARVDRMEERKGRWRWHEGKILSAQSQINSYREIVNPIPLQGVLVESAMWIKLAQRTM